MARRRCGRLLPSRTPCGSPPRWVASAPPCCFLPPAPASTCSGILSTGGASSKTLSSNCGPRTTDHGRRSDDATSVTEAHANHHHDAGGHRGGGGVLLQRDGIRSDVWGKPPVHAPPPAGRRCRVGHQPAVPGPPL